jgi:C-terminal processing protease CtpA/Prc
LTSASTNLQDIPINQTDRTQIINKVLIDINNYYVFPEVAKKIESAIQFKLKKNKYSQINTTAELAKQLTADFEKISHDKHLQIIYSEKELAPIEKRLTISEELKNIQLLNGNVGYLSFNFFAPPEIAAETAAAAINFLTNTDALIIDLRDNHGGDPAMVAFLASYFFGVDPVHLNDFYWRDDNSIHQSWTYPYVPGKRYLNKKVYLLISQQTFSGAEEFAYDLKTLNRATLIGKTTAGGANPSFIYTINKHLSIWIPGGRAINPITKTNWQDTGVKPDIEVAEDQALKTAYLQALQDIMNKTTDSQDLAALKKIIKDYNKELNGMH